MLLCVLSIVSLLPVTAMAADVKTDEVKDVVADAAGAIKKAATTKYAHAECWGSYKATLYRGYRYRFWDPLVYDYGSNVYYYYWGVKVKWQWYVKKKGSKKFVKIKGATKPSYTIKASNQNGWTYRVKVINKSYPDNWWYYQYKLKVKG